MDVLISLAQWSIFAFAALLFALQLTSYEIGYLLGFRRQSRAPGDAESVGVVVAGMLGLLAFVLALTLSFANTRFNERRLGTLAEANAIGTAWLRATALDDSPQATEVARLLEDYAKTRVDFVRADRGDETIAEATAKTSALQNEIWSHVTTIVRERPDAIAASLMASVNEVFDQSTSERFALGIRLPWQIFWLLISITALSAAFLGYQFGLKERPLRFLVVLLTAMWTVIIINILDLASARLGNFRTDLRVYDWTIQGFTNPSATGAATN